MKSDDERPEHGDEAEGQDRPVEGVRISGAAPAGDDLLSDWQFEEPSSSHELPHWTDEPTGQIPASLIRGRDEPTGSTPPVWREESSDWSLDEEPLDPILLGVDEANGLEFDGVVVVEPAEIASRGASPSPEEPGAVTTRGLRTLYVAMTRPTTRLRIVGSRPFPVALDA